MAAGPVAVDAAVNDKCRKVGDHWTANILLGRGRGLVVGPFRQRADILGVEGHRQRR